MKETWPERWLRSGLCAGRQVLPHQTIFFMDLALCTGDTVLESGTNDKKTKTESTQKYVDSEYLSRKQK